MCTLPSTSTFDFHHVHTVSTGQVAPVQTLILPACPMPPCPPPQCPSSSYLLYSLNGNRQLAAQFDQINKAIQVGGSLGTQGASSDPYS